MCNYLLGFHTDFSNVRKSNWIFISLNQLYWTIFGHWTAFREKAVLETKARDLSNTVNLGQYGRKVSPLEAYKHRGPLLRRFCLYDYAASVVTRKFDKRQNPSAWIPFHDPSENLKNSVQYVRSEANLATVVFNGAITDDFNEATHDIFYQR